MTSMDSPEDLIESLLALPQADRSAVLRQLTPEVRQRFLPMLQQAKRKDFSGSLQELIEGAADGRTPAGMTAIGAAALRRAYDADVTALQTRQSDGHSGVPSIIVALRKLLGRLG